MSAVGGVIVTGPPRSGTSAVTRLLDLSGLHGCAAVDRVGGGRNNPTGHWESKSVLAVNNRFLDEVGTRWWCPPAPGAFIANTGDIAAGFRQVHPASPWVCKDPRFAFTLPVWRAALDDIVACVVLLRRPDEVVASLQRTWPLSAAHAGALWMRYLHAAIAAAAGLPLAFVRFPEILTDVGRALAPLAAGLQPLGIELRGPSADALAEYLRAPTGSSSDQDQLPASVWPLWERLAAVEPGFVVGIGTDDEHPDVEAVLGPLRDELRAGRPIDTRPVFAGSGDSIG